MLNFFTNKLKRPSSQSGFSYIELVVIISIMGLLTGMIVVNFRQAEKRKAAALAGDTVINALRLTQNYTLGGKSIPSTATRVHNDTASTDCAAGSKAPSEYRIAFIGGSSTYTIYATDKCNDIWQIEQGKLPPKTVVKANGIKVDITEHNEVQLMFTPPFARMTIASSDDFSPAPTFNTFIASEITVEYTDPAFFKVVRIDAISGKIGEQ